MGKAKKLVHGVGINDADYSITIKEEIPSKDGKRRRKTIWSCPFYERWKNMLTRCYSTNYHKARPSYQECTVCEEWLTFSKFKEWMEAQDWVGKVLDKDLKVLGNKQYNPDTCLFISKEINNFITEANAIRGDFPIGVTYCKQTNKYTASCGNPLSKKREHLGRFASPEEAHLAWKHRKSAIAATLTNDEELLKYLLRRYK